MIDKILCFLILKIGFKREIYIGSREGVHVFYEEKSLFGFPKETGVIKKYSNISSVDTCTGNVIFGYGECNE